MSFFGGWFYKKLFVVGSYIVANVGVFYFKAYNLMVRRECHAQTSGIVFEAVIFDVILY